MNATGVAILANPHPCGHIVYPYTDEAHVAEALCLYTTAGLRNGESVILIMTSAHCEPIRYRLRMAGFDPGVYERSGRLTCVKTEDMLAELMVDGDLHEGRFKSIVDRMISHARSRASNGKVRVFGEMVSQLRFEDLEATARLEELWNEAINRHHVALLCTYVLTGPDDQVPEQLTSLHTHNIEREPEL